MMTTRQIERLWDARGFDRMFKDLTAARPEASMRLEFECGRATPAAAMGLIRLNELNQSHVPLYSQLLRSLLAAQESDGGWGDVMTTALCLRALLLDQGDGPAIERGLRYLVNLQKSEGNWPKVPIRRMPGDAYVSAFVLFQLGDCQPFREAVRLDDAANWFRAHEADLDAESRRLWDRAAIKCRLPQVRIPTPSRQLALWS